MAQPVILFIDPRDPPDRKDDMTRAQSPDREHSKNSKVRDHREEGRDGAEYSALRNLVRAAFNLGPDDDWETVEKRAQIMPSVKEEKNEDTQLEDAVKRLIEVIKKEVSSESQKPVTITVEADAEDDASEAEDDTDSNAPTATATVIAPTDEPTPKHEPVVPPGRYAISGVLSLDQLKSLTGWDGSAQVWSKLEASGVQVRESKQVFVPKTSTGKFSNLVNVNGSLNPSKKKLQSEFELVIPGTAAVHLGLKGGTFATRGRGTQYRFNASGEEVLEIAKNAKKAALAIMAQKSRNSADFALLNALDRTLGVFIEVL